MQVIADPSNQDAGSTIAQSAATFGLLRGAFSKLARDEELGSPCNASSSKGHPTEMVESTWQFDDRVRRLEKRPRQRFLW
jgi:hypothetical protein